MEFVTIFGFLLVALGLGAASLSSVSPADAGRWGGSADLPARLIGTGAFFLGCAATVWMWRNVADLLAARSLDTWPVARGLAPVGLGALIVGLSGGFAAPGVDQWRWGLLAGLLPGLLAAFLWGVYLLAPTELRTLVAFGLESRPEAEELGGLLRGVLAVGTAYPVLALLGTTAGAATARALGRREGDPHANAMLDSEAAGGLDARAAPASGAALRFTDVGGSWCQRIYEGGEEVAFLEIDPLAGRGGFELSGSYYKVVTDVLRRAYTLRWRGGPLAAARIASFGREFRIAVGDRELLLRPGSGLIPGLGELHVVEAGKRTGWVAPRPAHPEGGLAELPDDLPPPVRLFIIYLAILLRLRWSEGRAP